LKASNEDNKKYDLANHPLTGSPWLNGQFVKNSLVLVFKKLLVVPSNLVEFCRPSLLNWEGGDSKPMYRKTIEDWIKPEEEGLLAVAVGTALLVLSVLLAALLIISIATLIYG